MNGNVGALHPRRLVKRGEWKRKLGLRGVEEGEGGGKDSPRAEQPGGGSGPDARGQESAQGEVVQIS